MIKEQNELLGTLTHRSIHDKSKYSPIVRDFCFRMQYHSTAAYNELRKFFGNRLPCVRTLQKWLRCVEVGPGISEIALGALAEKAKTYKDEGKQLHLCLISDEMGIRKQITWNAEKESFDGFATELNSKSRLKSKLPLAKDALVFMAVGPNFKVAVAYFLLSGLDAVERAALTREVIKSVDATGAKSISLTSDGLSANCVAKLYGADFKSEKPFFPRPGQPNEKIYVVFDPSHMIKLVRKYFSEHQLYYRNDKLRWNMLVKLAERQDTDNFETGNKLNMRHINWKQTPMVVKLAVQTLSNSVADTIEQLTEDKYDDFIGSESTVKFLRLHNNLFDFQNYGVGKKTDNHFKNFVSESNIDKFTALGNEYKNFVSNLTIDEGKGRGKKKRITNKKVLNSRSSMGFFGFWHNITSALGIYNDYVKNGPLDQFSNFQFSQDHLETFFSLMRSRQGANNNPNTKQFEYAYRKLLICTPNLSSRATNCIIDGTDLLTVSSVLQPAQKQATQQIQPSIQVMSAIEKFQLEFGYYDLINSNIDDYERHTHAFVASNVQQKIMKNMEARSVSGCKDCWKVFDENTRLNDGLLAKKGQTAHIIQPCISTVNILIVFSTIVKYLQSQITYIDFDILIRAIWPCLDTDSLYEASNFIDHDGHSTASNSAILSTHKEQFINSIIREYMHIKSIKICDRITTEEHKGRNIRKKHTKNVIFAGQ